MRFRICKTLLFSCFWATLYMSKDPTKIALVFQKESHVVDRTRMQSALRSPAVWVSVLRRVTVLYGTIRATAV